MKQISKHNVCVALLYPDVPVPDNVHKAYGIFPPELLHTTAEGTSKYIIESVVSQISPGASGKRACDIVDTVHLNFHQSLSRNSERDFPLGATISGLTKEARIDANERKGNLFRSMCICHTHTVRNTIGPILQEHGLSMEKLTTFLKLYISMEAWFHDDNPEVKVRAARLLIAKVIDMMIEILPRGGQGWHIPKVHGLTKVQTFIILFGCAANFYGNHGECMHQDLVKNTGNNTQKRPGSFTTQVAVR